MITISSPKKGDVTLALSMATIIRSASMVLRECETGGKDMLGLGEWSVIVSKGVVGGGGRWGRERGRDGGGIE